MSVRISAAVQLIAELIHFLHSGIRDRYFNRDVCVHRWISDDADNGKFGIIIEFKNFSNSITFEIFVGN